MNAFLSAVTDVSGSLATVLDVASVSWLVVAVALMVLGEFESSRARKARWALVPVALITRRCLRCEAARPVRADARPRFGLTPTE